MNQEKVEKALAGFFSTLLAIVLVAALITGIAYAFMAFVWWTPYADWMLFPMRSTFACINLYGLWLEINKWGAK